ncbi:CXC [Nesidiocoris tenuis]|uniref:CXC n=1 Tax=Nesidiocoris tenuis TaxID=355587 RepID=A0ABN7AIE2_9HEMI|nr:CXC [Nesidiocoris tenuis]
MSESMNLDSNDIVGSLEGFESLEHIQAELGILDETSQGNQGDHVEVLELMRHPIVDKRRDGNVKNEIIMEDDMGDDDEMIASRLEESMSTHMMHSNVSDIMHNVMDMDEHEVENERMDQGSHDGHADDLDQRRLFSEGVIKNEIIVDSQVMTEGLGDDDNSIEAASIHNEQILTDSDVRYLDDIMNDGVNETVIEAAEVEDQTAEMECSFVTLPGLPSLDTSANTNEEIIVADQNPELATADRFLNQDVVKTEKIDDTPSSISLTSFAGTNLQPPPLTLVSKTDLQVQEAVKSITSGVYVVNSSTASTALPSNLIQSGGTLLAPKDAKISRVVTIPHMEGNGQTIRIVAPQGKFNSTAKAITLSQARQMGLKISNVIPGNAKTVGSQPIGISKLVVPASKKTVTVVKSPTKILPGPPPPAQRPQKVLIRQANSLKTGTLLTSSAQSSAGAHMIRIPANQAIQQILPGGSKQVQYVKLISTGTGSKTSTLVPVSLSKTIPVLTTNMLNPSTTFKVLPVSTQARTAPATQRVLIPATSASSSTPTQISSSPQIVVLPSHLLQQVKKGDCKITTVTPSIPGLKPAATVNGNRKIAPALPPLKAKETSPVEAPAAPADEALENLEPMPLAQPVLEPPAQLPPVPAQLPPSPEPPKPLTVTSFAEEEPGTRAAPEADSLCRRSSSPPSSPSSTLMPRQEMKPADPRQEQWSGDESYVEANGIRPRKPCNCTKSMCLKLYCDCFANGEFCYQCNCLTCFNNLSHEEDRQRAIKSCLERNPTAFRPKIGKTLAGSEERRHNRGCHCKRSGCLKNYCECYEAKIPCSKNCKCAGCKNTDAYFGKRGDDDRLRSDKMYDTSGHLYSAACRNAFSMLTPEVIQATCMCLIARAENFDDSDKSEEAPRLIIEEFGHCLVQIIDSLTKSIPQDARS